MTREVRAGYLAPTATGTTGSPSIALSKTFRSPRLTRQGPQSTPSTRLAHARDVRCSSSGREGLVFTVKDFLAGGGERFPDAEVHIFGDAVTTWSRTPTNGILPLMQAFRDEQTHDRSNL